MKLNAKDLKNISLIDAREEKLGKITDLLFDDREWKVRYLVVDTGGWLEDKRVLISPDQAILTPASVEAKQLHCTLTKDTIGQFPPLDSHAPVSRRYEMEMASYYKTTPYWAGDPIWSGASLGTNIPATPEQQAQHEMAVDEIEKCHVRSANEIEGYEVFASNDVSLGEVDCLEINWTNRTIENIATREGFLWMKEERDIPPSRVASIDWHHRRVTLDSAYVNDFTSEGTNLSSATS